MKNSNRIDKERKISSLEDLTDEQLVEQKKQAIETEDYDKAKEIKQEQERRKLGKVDDIEWEKVELERIKMDQEKSENSRQQKIEAETLIQQLIEDNNTNLSEGKESLEKFSKDELYIIWYLAYYIKSSYSYNSDIEDGYIYQPLNDIMNFVDYTDEEKKYFLEKNNISTKSDFENYIIDTISEFLKERKVWNKTYYMQRDLDNLKMVQETINGSENSLDCLKITESPESFKNWLKSFISSKYTEKKLTNLYNEIDLLYQKITEKQAIHY